MPAIENNTLYLTLNGRNELGSFHWGIFLASSNAPKGQLYHAATNFGPWQLETKITKNILFSKTLIIAYKLGSVSFPAALDQVVRGVPADGSPSQRTGEAFTCRIWVKDAIVALHESGILTLGADIDTIEKDAREKASGFQPDVEKGNPPTVIDGGS